MVAKLNNLPREAHFRTLEYDDSTQIALYSKISYKVALDKPLFNRDSNLQFLRNHYDSTTSHFKGVYPLLVNFRIEGPNFTPGLIRPWRFQK